MSVTDKAGYKSHPILSGCNLAFCLILSLTSDRIDTGKSKIFGSFELLSFRGVLRRSLAETNNDSRGWRLCIVCLCTYFHAKAVVYVAEKDVLEKTLEAYNDVFADIVNGLLFQGAQVVKEDALTDAQPFSMYKADGKVHEQIRDISKFWITEGGLDCSDSSVGITGNRDRNRDRRRRKWRHGGKNKKESGIRVRLSCFGFENQSDYDKDMPIRVIGYDGASYRAQLSGKCRKERYPVVTLVLYFGYEPWGKSRSLYDVIDIPERLKPYVSDYQINVFEIAHLPEAAVEYFHSDFKIVVDYFVNSRTNSDYRPSNPAPFQHVDELLALMSVVTHDSRFVESLYEEGEKPKDMCEVLDRAEARGQVLGEKIGQARGEKIGQAQGIFLANLSGIKNVMREVKCSAQRAMDILQISDQDRPKYLSRL